MVVAQLWAFALDLGGVGRKRGGGRDRPTAVPCGPVQCLAGDVPGAL